MVHAPENGIQRRITICIGKYGMLEVEDEGLHQLTIRLSLAPDGNPQL